MTQSRDQRYRTKRREKLARYEAALRNIAFGLNGFEPSSWLERRFVAVARQALGDAQ